MFNVSGESFVSDVGLFLEFYDAGFANTSANV